MVEQNLMEGDGYGKPLLIILHNVEPCIVSDQGIRIEDAALNHSIYIYCPSAVIPTPAFQFQCPVSEHYEFVILGLVWISVNKVPGNVVKV